MARKAPLSLSLYRTLALAMLACGIAGPAMAVAPCVAGRNLLPDLPAEQRRLIDAEAGQQANGAGKLYRISRDGAAPSTLFGTLHVTDPRVLNLPQPVATALDEAATIVIETTDILDERRMAAAILSRPDLMNLPRGQHLADFYGVEDAGRVDASLGASGLPIESVRTLQPWFLATSLLSPACERQRLAQGGRLLDIDIAERAGAAGKTVSGLETGEEQLEALASLPLPDQAEMLLSVIDSADRMDDLFETMTALYLEGNIAAIVPAMEAIAPSSDDSARSAEIWQVFDERIVRRRNHVMMERAGPILEKGDAFIAVGAQHLVGDEGLVALLRQAGWSVERID